MSDKFWMEKATRNLFYEQFRRMAELEKCYHRAIKDKAQNAALVDTAKYLCDRYLKNKGTKYEFVTCIGHEDGSELHKAWQQLEALTNGDRE